VGQRQCAAGVEAALCLPQWALLKLSLTKLGCTRGRLGASGAGAFSDHLIQEGYGEVSSPSYSVKVGKTRQLSTNLSAC
jgi:hypothetical protein